MSRARVFRLFLMSLLASSAAAVADGPGYSYIQGSYGQIEVDDVDVDGDGFGVAGSAALTEHFHLFGGYSTADMGSGVDVNQLEAGVGYNHPVSDTVDVVLSLAYLSAEVDLPGPLSIDDSGYGLGVGLRGMLTPALEVNGELQFVDFGDGGDDTGFGAGFLYNFTEQFAAGASGDWTGDISTYQLNARFLFGN